MRGRDITRRRVLRGVTTGSIVLSASRFGDGTRFETREKDSAMAALEANASAPEIDIVETNAPVNGGEYLEVTTEIENTGGVDIRPEIDFVVGYGEERLGRRTMTISAGETRTVQQGFFTYPVPNDDEFPVRVEAGGDGDERTVVVDGASELPTATPGRELTVQPGTTVLFEAEPIDPDEGHRTRWWVDGEFTSQSFGPWASTYFAEEGMDFFMHTFESSGTHEIAASVVPGRGDPTQSAEETYMARWEIDVSSGGKGAPAIERRQPTEDVLEFAPDDDLEFELEVSVSGADRSLDRVVWWLTQADVILDVTEMSGTLDTATLPTDGGALCHTCRVSPWIVCADGTTRELDEAWVVNRVEDDDDEDQIDGTLEVRILETNSPVEAGAFLEAIVEVENTGGSTASDELEFIVGHDPQRVDTQAVTVSGGDTGTATLGFETYPTSRDERFPVRVIGADDADETMVQVIA